MNSSRDMNDDDEFDADLADVIEGVPEELAEEGDGKLDYEELKREYDRDDDVSQQEASILIDDDSASHLNVMDLSTRRIVRLDEQQIDQFTSSIDVLELYENRMESLPPSLARLTKLSVLDISRNRFKNIPNVVGLLSSLRELYVSANQISEIPDEVYNLPNLELLECTGNSLSTLSQRIERMRSLVTIDLSMNVLTELPEEFQYLTSLERLNLTENRLTRLPVSIGKLTQLRTLEARENQLSLLPPGIQWLQSLEHLDLAWNNLAHVPSQVGKLANLKVLDLAGNKIKDVPPQLGQLAQLGELDLSNNEIQTLPKELGNLPNSVSIKLDGNPLAEPLPSILERGTPSLLTYLRSLSDGTPQYEAKVLLVGEGGVGKSSLIAALRGEKFVQDRPTTHGIELNKLTPKHPTLNAVMQLNSWDFGGQEVYRITHQFFFSKRALYLLVWKPREGHEENNIEHWCRRIRLRVGDHARIIIVATHVDERRPEFDYQNLRVKFPHLLVGYAMVDSESQAGLEELRRVIAEEASKLPQMGEILSQSWARAREEVLSQDGAHISRMLFERICARHGLDEESAETLGALLHDLGHVIHYNDDDGLRDIVVLQPEWLTKAIGYVLEDENIRQTGGVLAHDRLKDIWSSRLGVGYDPRLHPYFLRLMEKFDVSYRLPHIESSLVAQLVPYQRPPDIWQDYALSSPSRRVLRTICRLGDEAVGIISWLTVRNHRFSTGRHWRRGVLLTHKSHGSDAVFELMENNRDIVLTVVGPAPDYFFHVLRDGLEEMIQQRWRGLQYTFLISCPNIDDDSEPCRGAFSLKSLERFRARDVLRIDCHECCKSSDVNVLLTGFGRLTAPLESLLEGMSLALLQSNDKLDRLQAQSSRIASHVRSALKILSTEVADCPRLFTLFPKDRSKVRDSLSLKQAMTLTLWCEEPGSEHECAAAAYNFRPSKEWVATVSPYVRFVCKALKVVVPIGAAAYGATVTEEQLKSARANLELMKALADKLPVEKNIYGSAKVKGMTRAEGAGLRAFRALLFEIDATRSFGELRRVTHSSGDLLWVCPDHYREYDPGLPAF